MIQTKYWKIINTLCAILMLFSLVSLFSVKINESNEIIYCFHPVAGALFAIFLIILIVFHKKLAFFHNAFVFFKIDKDKLAEKSIIQKIIYLANKIVTPAFIVLYSVLLIFSFLSRTTVILVFLGSLLLLILQLLDRILCGEASESYRLFVVSAIVLCMMMTYTLPFFTGISWDDQIHFGNIYDMVQPFTERTSFAVYRFKDPGSFYSISDFIQNPRGLSEQLFHDSEIEVLAGKTRPGITSFSAYLGPVLSMAILAALGADMFKISVICRLTIGILFALIVGKAIKKLKSGGYIFSVICLLPTVLFLSSSFSYDSWVIAMFAYVSAWLISEFQQPEKKISIHECVVLFCAVFLGSTTKAIYFFLLIPFLFLSKTKFQSEKQKKGLKWVAISTMILIAILIMLPMFVNKTGFSDMRGGDGVNSSEQIRFILTHPIKYTGILFGFFADYLSLNFATQSINFYAYLGSGLPLFGGFAILLLIYAIFTEHRESHLHEPVGKVRLGSIFVCLIQIVLVATSLYISFTPVGYETVNGCAYRYMFPILPMLLYMLSPTRIVCTVSDRLQKGIVFIGIALVSLASYFSVYICHFF